MEDKLVAFTETQVLVKLLDLITLHSDEVYDVDMFIDDVEQFEWPGRLDPDAQVNFNCGVMAFCKLGMHFSLAADVILFTELSEWAARYFNPEM